MDLIQSLSILSSKLDKSYNSINNGGCGLVTASATIKLLPLIPTAKIAIYNDDNPTNEIRKLVKDVDSLKSWNDQGWYINHTYMYFEHNNKQWLFDSNGVHKFNEYMEFTGTHNTGSITAQELLTMSNNTDGWNPWFNRNQSHGIKIMIGKFANALLNQL